MLTAAKIQGKTYSLFGSNDNTEKFYETIDTILDSLLKKHNPDSLLTILQLSSRNISQCENFIKENNSIAGLFDKLKNYTAGVEEHYRQQPFFKIWNNVMKLRKWQYHLYMIEFALTNRINRAKFLNCEIKIALLPYCLRDLSANCRAVSDGTDYLCRRCSKNCFINEASVLLAKEGIKPYIWMSANLKKVIRNSNPHSKPVGVLGIACIPELINGMRLCEKKGIPAIGLPLNANRCKRWMGEFNPNSINTEMLGKLILSEHNN
jgi:hypothetical protein